VHFVCVCVCVCVSVYLYISSAHCTHAHTYTHLCIETHWQTQRRKKNIQKNGDSDMAHSYMCHDSFACVKRRILVCDLTRYACDSESCHTCRHGQTHGLVHIRLADTKTQWRPLLTALHYNTLHCTVTHCNILQHTATYCHALQHI